MAIETLEATIATQAAATIRMATLLVVRWEQGNMNMIPM